MTHIGQQVASQFRASLVLFVSPARDSPEA